MKILMFGRGVIATIYGWALRQAGHDVEFYVRPGRAATYGDAVDLDLFDTRRRVWGQRVAEKWPVRYREALEPDHDVDLIVLSVPHHRLAEATAFLSPRVGQATVLIFGNLWTEPLAAIGALPADQIAWGFPQAGGGFGADGVLHGRRPPAATCHGRTEPGVADVVTWPAGQVLGGPAQRERRSPRRKLHNGERERGTAPPSAEDGGVTGASTPLGAGTRLSASSYWTGSDRSARMKGEARQGN